MRERLECGVVDEAKNKLHARVQRTAGVLSRRAGMFIDFA